MRPLEWVLLVAFGPILILSLSGKHRDRGWLIAATSLPVLASVLQAAREGWRTQSAPLYLLSVAVLLWYLPLLAGRGSTVAPQRRALSGVIISAVLVLVLVLAGWLLPVVWLPEPTGPYAVGFVDRELFDEARGRRLMVTVWYPAAQLGTPAPLTRHPDELMAGLAELTGLPSPMFQHLRYVRLAATDGAPMLPAAAPYPLLVFSHGLVGMRLQSSSTLQDLASWGYVVVALDHTDAAAVTVFPDGEARYYDSARFGIPAGLEPSKDLVNERMFPVWVADQRFVYDTLETWAQADSMFAGALDTQRIGSVGHSFGGAAALEVCLVEARCQAAVNLDGALYGMSETMSAPRPIMVMSSSDSLHNAEATAGWDALIARSEAAFWAELPNSGHLSFTFSQLLSPVLVPPGYDPREGLRIMDRHVRAFFDAHLRETTPFPASDGDADVRWLAR